MTLTVEEAKEQVVNIGLRLIESRLVVGTWGNISTFIKKENKVVITPSGVDYTRMQARDTVVLDLDGNIVEGELKPSTESQLHLSVYKKRNDIRAVVHTHSVYASALAVARKPLPPILEDMTQLIGGQVPVAEYAPAGTKELAENAVSALENYNSVLLANHGLVGVGMYLEEALRVCLIVERTAKVYILAGMLGTPFVLDEEEVKAQRYNYLNYYGQR
ncbi:class II aldolase/adducin family protein [Desulfolucanica intricata]|uniref:class II aldolase/adducin family protein n=1 Tax=Desulfolucanica intricata TaxID=1285191 RepID=UPI0008314DA4|nr:class II aldolase/adducin family protein [Desulfolucanica intricata]